MNHIYQNFIDLFNALAREVHETAKEKGWWDQQTADEWYKDIGRHKEYFTLQGDPDIESALKAAYKAGQQSPPPNKGEKISLMHSELSEALEGIRKPGPDEHCPDFTKEEIEKADVIIRILDEAEYYNLRIGEAIIAKMVFNKTREYKHGGKKF